MMQDLEIATVSSVGTATETTPTFSQIHGVSITETVEAERQQQELIATLRDKIIGLEAKVLMLQELIDGLRTIIKQKSDERHSIHPSLN